jgi:hypothetical protein
MCTWGAKVMMVVLGMMLKMVSDGSWLQCDTIEA